MRALSHILGLALMVALSGCHTTTLSPKRAFFRQHPELRARYPTFAETSFEVIDEARESNYRSREIMVESLRENFSTYPDLIDRLDGIKKRLRTFHDGERDFFKEARREFDPATDALFYYDYRPADGGQEQGWVIIRHGKIHKKFWAASTLENPGDKP